MNYKVLILLFIIIAIGCKKDDTIVLSSTDTILTTSTWMIQKSSGVGGGYNYSFDRNNGADPFQFAKVRLKLETNGSISGIDNNGNAIKNATWKYSETDKKMEISGTGIFGIDGTLDIVTLQSDLVEVKNTLKVPQLSSNVDLKATLVPAK
jgi:hypothetical protein